MNKLIGLLLGVAFAVTSNFTLAGENIPLVGLTYRAIGSDEVANGIIEALKVGSANSVEKASKTDGFYKNADIYIDFPKDVAMVKKALVKVGVKKPVEEFELSMNRAAEEACKKALPVLLDAIKGITIADAASILGGSKDAATSYLKDKTTANLKVAFKPIVKEAISKVNVTKYWKSVANAYNKVNALSKLKKLDPDLESYITDKAIDGLFILLAKEEEQIRSNPAARTTDLLKKIFG